MNTTWSRPTRYIAGVSIVLLALFFIYLARSVIPLLVTAALIAVIVSPLINWLHKRAKFPRGLAVALVYLLLIFLIPLLVTLAVPAIVEAFRYVVDLDYAAILEDVIGWLRATLAGIRDTRLPVPALDLYVDQMAQSLLTGLEDVEPATTPSAPSVETILSSLGAALTVTFDAATGIVGAVFSRITLFIFLILASVYMSLSAHTYPSAFLNALPEHYRPEISTLMARLGRTWNAFFRGQLSLMLIIGLVSWLGLTILGVPGAPSLGIIAGLLEIIPNLGPVLATIPAVIVALLQGSSWIPVSNLTMALIVVGLYVLIQQLENSVIVPRLLGGAVDLPPLVVMTAVLAGATSFGILGALLATPVIASLREILRYVFHKIEGVPPYHAEEMAQGPDPLPGVDIVDNLRERVEELLAPPMVPATSTVADGGQAPPTAVLPMNTQSRFVDVAGMRIHYYAAGESGPVVLLLHGGGIDSAHLSWGLLLPELAQGFRVFAPDFPGYGQSSRPKDFPHTVESLVAFAGQFMDALAIERASLVGISMGGSVSIGYTLLHPERVEKLVLVDSYGLQRAAPLNRLSYLYLKTPGLNALTWTLMRNRPAVKYSLGSLLKHPGAVTDELVDLAMEEVRRPQSGRAFQVFQNSEVTWNGTRTVFMDRLGEIAAPVLIVHGEKDTLVPRECALEALERLPNARLEWIKGAGHWPQRDDPESFNRVVRAFLEH